MSTIEMPIAILLAVVSIFTVLISNIYANMKKPVEKLTEAVNNLNTFMSVTEVAKETHEKRLFFLEEENKQYQKNISEFFQKYQDSLNFINENKKSIQKLLP